MSSISAFVRQSEDPDLQAQFNEAMRVSRELQAYVASLPRPASQAPSQVFNHWSKEVQDNIVHLTQKRQLAWMNFAAELLHHQYPTFDAEIDALLHIPSGYNKGTS